MRIGTVMSASGAEATVYIDDLDIRVKCQMLENIAVKENDSVVVELLPGGFNGVIIGVM